MPEVVFTQACITAVGPDWLQRLKHEARRAPRRRARLCLHGGHGDAVQEMVIAFCRGSLVRPHRHPGRSESLHVIEGELAVLVFDDDGRVQRRIDLAAGGAGPFMYRCSAPLWHTVVPVSDLVVAHEVTAGPFAPDASEFAPWAPDDASALDAFLCNALESGVGASSSLA